METDTPISAEAIKTKTENSDREDKRQRKRKEAIAQPENTTEKPQPQETAKSPQQEVQTEPVFPAEGKLNKYGFIYLNDNVLTAWLGRGKGAEARLKIDLRDGIYSLARKY